MSHLRSRKRKRSGNVRRLQIEIGELNGEETGQSYASVKGVVGAKFIGYFEAVRTKIEKMGDGFGLLLPKELLDACGFGQEATVTVQNQTLIVTPGPRGVREGWAEALGRIPEEELDRDFAELQAFREAPEEWDATQWQWPESGADEKV